MTRTPSAATYDDDFFAWTQEQADLLRRLAPTAIGPDLDIAHVAEEIEDLGKRDLREVRSFLARFFEHLIKIDATPWSVDVPHWRSEARLFRRSASAAYTPSMKRLLDVSLVWNAGSKEARSCLIDRGASPMTDVECPFTLDDLLVEDFDLDAALARLASATTDPASARP